MKFKKALLNVVTYGMLGWGAISAIYLALPIDVKELLPDMNWVTAVVSGGSTTVLGSASLYIQAILNKSKLANNEVLAGLTNILTNTQAEYKNITEGYSSVVSAITDMTTATNRNNLLLETQLKAKLDNPMLTDTARKLIEGVLNEEETVL